MRVLPDLDLPSLREAYRARDLQSTFTIGDVVLTLAPIALYVERFAERDRDGIVDGMAIAIHRALTSATDYGVEHINRPGSRVYTCLAARAGDRIVVGAQPSHPRTPFPNPGWQLGRWFAEPAKNTKRVAAWTSDPERAGDCIAFAIARREVVCEDASGATLLGAVLADPDDTAARLVYADWLHERGDVRGELIHLQCELATVPLRDPRRLAIRARERELVASVGSVIAGDLAGVVERYVLRRGLVDAITIRPPMFARHADRLIAAHPIRDVRVLVSSAWELAQLGTIRGLARIPHVEISARPKSTGSKREVSPETLAGTRLFAQTTRLVFADMIVGGAHSWNAVLATLEAPALRMLGLVDCDAGASELALLADPAKFPALEALRLDSFPPFALAERLGDLVRRPNLRALELRRTQLADAVLADTIVAIAQHAPALTTLGLYRCPVGDRAFAAIIGLLADRRLDRLELTGDVPLERLAALLRAPELANVTELVIDPFLRDDRESDLLAEALLAGPGTTRIDWFWGDRLGQRCTQVLAHVDVVRTRADDSVDLVDRAR